MLKLSHIGRMGLVVCAGATLALATASFASAREGRGSSDGDSLERQEQQNPRFIQPYGWTDPATYRLGHPRAGYYARQGIEGQRGYVRVRPYEDDED